MYPIEAKKAKRTISMLSLKVHVDEDDYQTTSEDCFHTSYWIQDEEELLASIGAEGAT